MKRPAAQMTQTPRKPNAPTLEDVITPDEKEPKEKRASVTKPTGDDDGEKVRVSVAQDVGSGLDTYDLESGELEALAADIVEHDCVGVDNDNNNNTKRKQD